MKENSTEASINSEKINNLIDFFEHNDMGEYLENMPEVQFDIDLKRKTCLVTIDEEILNKIVTIARVKQISSQSLINSWLREKISEYK